MIMSVDGLVVITLYYNNQTEAPTRNLGFSREERIKALTMHKRLVGGGLFQHYANGENFLPGALGVELDDP